MLSQNLKTIRKERGYSQETLALRLNVVRQTVSKWEKGISVPDAQMLIKIAEELDTSVAQLLGDTIESSSERDVISRQLEQLNTLLAERNRRSRRIWKTIFIVIIALVATAVVTMILMFVFSIYVPGRTDGPEPAGPIESHYEEQLCESGEVKMQTHKNLPA